MLNSLRITGPHHECDPIPEIDEAILRIHQVGCGQRFNPLIRHRGVDVGPDIDQSPAKHGAAGQDLAQFHLGGQCFIIDRADGGADLAESGNERSHGHELIAGHKDYQFGPVDIRQAMEVVFAFVGDDGA